MTTLKTTLESIAQKFAAGVLDAIKTASLSDLAEAPRGTRTTRTSAPRASAPTPKKSNGRLHRRTPAEIEKTLGAIVSLLKAKKTGLRSEQIRDALKLDKRELPRVLGQGLTAKKLKSKGVRRATTYTAV
jgi:hypothetical protein